MNMINADSLTPDELRALADKKEKEAKVFKKGTLKIDLYDFKSTTSTGFGFYHPFYESFHLFSLADKNHLLREFTSKFSLVLKKGTEFVCYKINNQEHWHDNINYGLENMSKNWAELYLENIHIVE